MRVALDTNVFVSGLYFGGIPEKLLDLIEKGIITPCFVPTTFSELERVLWHKKFIFQRNFLPFSADSFLEKLKSHSLFFPQSEKVPLWIKKDKQDNYVLSCAMSCGADFIVSGDKHLLELRSFHGISILTPKAFLERFKGLKNNKRNK